jgi:ubiquinone/menaquinone biosynthesis C-methylase UbiE
MTPYIFNNAAEAETAQRFNSLDALYNFRTFRFLETTGIGSGWHCLEVGGGSGSVAVWLAERAGPSGHVVVTDIDPRFMERSTGPRPANLEVRRHDIGTDPLPDATFDLIHARLVLSHVPQRHQVLPRLATALKPRGWLVIEEFDGRLVDRAIPTANPADAEHVRKLVGALWRLMDERGFEADWPRRVYRHLKAVGLTEVGMEGHLAVHEGGSAGARMDAANLAQIRGEVVTKGLITDAEVDAALTRLDAPDFAVFSPVMFTAWGRRPQFTADRASASVAQSDAGDDARH